MCDRRNVGIIFDGSFEGFLCIIYNFYYKKIVPEDIVCTDKFQFKLGINYENIETDFENAVKVADGIKSKISRDSFGYLYAAFFNKDDDKYMNLFNYIISGFKIGWKIDLHIHWDFVLKTHKYSSNTLGEAHFFKEFIRFSDTKNGTLYSRIEPENNVLAFIADHFASRLISEKWIVHDVRRNLAVIYDTKDWAIFETPANAFFEMADEEKNYQELWTAFFNEISIKERESRKRQRNMLPIRYRKNMLEFKR